jgi:ribosome maturation factor RimP
MCWFSLLPSEYHAILKTGNISVCSQEVGPIARFFFGTPFWAPFWIGFGFMSSRVSSITKQVAGLVEPSLEDMGFELVDVEYLSMHGKWVLRLYIDKEGGVTLDDCAIVSREIGDLIDVKDVIVHEYILEVSSPGLDRPLKKEKDFKGAIGKKIKVKTVRAVEGRRNYTGYLRNFQEGILYMELESGQVHLPWKDVDKANLVYEFNP